MKDTVQAQDIACLGSDCHSGSVALCREPAGIHDQICCLSVANKLASSTVTKQGCVRCVRCQNFTCFVRIYIFFFRISRYVFTPSLLCTNSVPHVRTLRQPNYFKEIKLCPTHLKLQLLLIHLNGSRPTATDHKPYSPHVLGFVLSCVASICICMFIISYHFLLLPA